MKAIGSSEMALEKPVVLDNRFGFRMFSDMSVPLTSIGCHEKALNRLEKSAGDWMTVEPTVEHEEPSDKIHLQFTLVISLSAIIQPNSSVNTCDVCH